MIIFVEKMFIYHEAGDRKVHKMRKGIGEVMETGPRVMECIFFACH